MNLALEPFDLTAKLAVLRGQRLDVLVKIADLSLEVHQLHLDVCESFFHGTVGSEFPTRYSDASSSSSDSALSARISFNRFSYDAR